MSASQSGVFNTQQFTDLGAPLVGGRLYTYAQGTTTQKTAYTDHAGTIPHTYTSDGLGGQYIALNARGELPAPLYLSGGSYDIALKTAAGATVWTRRADPVWDIANDLSGSGGSAILGYLPAGVGAVATTVQEKLREGVSVKDEGVIGDGVTDDRGNLNTAFTNFAGSFGTTEVLLPRGTYLINSNLSVPSSMALRFAAGAVIKIATGVTLTLNGNQIIAGRQKIFDCVGTGKVAGTVSNDLIFPEWWGAIADGLPADFPTRAANGARNSPAIQAALNFAGNQYAISGLTGTVSLTWGSYITDTTTNIPLSVNLIGYGIGSAIFYYAPTGNAVDMYLTNNSLVSDIFIAPLPGPTWNFTTGIGLRVDNVSTPCVRNVWCSGFGQADFYIKSSVEGRFYGLISDNTNGIAFDISGVGQGSIFENCTNAGSDNNAFYVHDGYDWTLIGCVAKSSTALKGFYLNACENVNLIGCNVHGIKQHGYELTSSTLNCSLTNCVANDPGSSGSAYHGFSISGARNKLNGCKTTGNALLYGYGLYFGGGATDCSSVNGNFLKGVLGSIGDFSPIGNNTYQIPKQTTTDATPVAIWFKGMNNNTTVAIEATVVANQRGGTGRAVYKFWCLAKTDGTATALIAGPTSIYSFESLAGLDATFVLTTATANAGVVSLQITGVAGLSVDWEATVSAIGVTG